MRQHDLASGGRHARQQRRHFDIVGEAGDELIDHAALPYGARDLRHLDVGRPPADEPFGVEVPHLLAASTASHDRDVRHVGIIRHRGHGGFDTALDEFGAHMGVEHGTRVLIAHRSLRMKLRTTRFPFRGTMHRTYDGRRYSEPANPACSMTLPQRAISLSTKRLSSAGGGLACGMAPSLTSASVTAGSLMISWMLA